MKKISPVITIILSFLVTIFIGTLLFMLPISLKKGNSINFMDAFFLSVSAISTTGLTTISDVSNTLSLFGKIILLLLIQIGGLGCISVAAFLFLTLKAKIGINDRYLIKEALNQDKVSNVLKLLKSIMKITFLIEIFGAIINFIVFIQEYSFFESLFISLFHSVSSFCNAGFDILGNNSLIDYSSNILLNINTMIISILGGLGFIVIKDILINKGNYKKLKIHSKIVLTMTFSIILTSTILIKISQGNQINWIEALFSSVNASSSGFSTINCLTLNSASILILSIVMIIGGSPVSAGGGIKTTTVYTMIKSMISFAKGKQTIVNNKKISEETKLKAFTLFFFAITFILIAIVSILIIEKNNTNLDITNVLFEACSAFSTCGLTLGVTRLLSIPSQLVLCLLMLVGRIGPITIMGMWNNNWNKVGVNNIEYLEEKIIIG